MNKSELQETMAAIRELYFKVLDTGAPCVYDPERSYITRKLEELHCKAHLMLNGKLI